MKTIEAVVSGRVQGVGFRSLVVSKASEFGINGIVKNNKDGTVTIICQGNEKKIEKFLESVAVSNSSIRVESINKSEARYAKEYSDFSIEF